MSGYCVECGRYDDSLGITEDGVLIKRCPECQEENLNREDGYEPIRDNEKS